MNLRLLSAERAAVAQHDFFCAIAFYTLLCRRCYKGKRLVTSSFAVPTKVEIFVKERCTCKIHLQFQRFGKERAKFIAKFSATNVTSLQLSLSLYLSLSPSAPQAQYRKRFRASYIVREVQSVRERERDGSSETEVTSPLSR